MTERTFIKASYNEELNTVEFIADTGDRLLRRGGTIAWRFNNPGNLRPGGKYKRHIGQGRTRSGPFLIFPTPDAGRQEKRDLLLRKYSDFSISSMLYRYAPPTENDTELYISSVCKKTGFSRDQVIGHCSEAELKKLMTAMEEHEGYNHKKETREEKWVYTTNIALSDGARPLAAVPVKLKRNEEEIFGKTDLYGRISPIVHSNPGEKVELWVKDSYETWQHLETISLGKASDSCVFVSDSFVMRGTSAQHNPINKSESPASFRYVVQPHDTLSKIAATFKVEAGKIEKDNGIKNPNVIMPGLVLAINRADFGASKAPPPAERPTVTLINHASKATSGRSKEGMGHPLALIPVKQMRAPWMEVAIAEARRWAGRKEDEITKESNYHVLLKTGRKTLVGNSNPWCASFVNWCMKQAGYIPSSAPAASQSFRRDKNYVKLDVPVYGAIVVFTSEDNPGRGHVGFLYAMTTEGKPIVLGGNQSDTINFESRFTQKLSGYFVPLSYLDFAKKELATGRRLKEASTFRL